MMTLLKYECPTTGRLGPIPYSKDEAVRNNEPRYKLPRGQRCPHDACDELYTVNDRCVACTCNEMRLEYVKDENNYPWSPALARKNGKDIFYRPKNCMDGPHIISRFVDGRPGCATCKTERAARVSPRQAAIRKGEAKYMPDKHCEHCGQKAKKHVVTGVCDGCIAKAPLTASPRKRALHAGEAKYRPDSPCEYCGQVALKRVDNGVCDGCVARRRPPTPEPTSPRQVSLAAGLKVYIPVKPCAQCGQHAQRHVDNGYCEGCDDAELPQLYNTARQLAMYAGESKYAPGDRCPKCKEYAPRNVANGRCDGCTNKTYINAATRCLVDNAPETVITKDLAVAMGLSAYREVTGGWRYVFNDKAVKS